MTKLIVLTEKECVPCPFVVMAVEEIAKERGWEAREIMKEESPKEADLYAVQGVWVLYQGRMIYPTPQVFLEENGKAYFIWSRDIYIFKEENSNKVDVDKTVEWAKKDILPRIEDFIKSEDKQKKSLEFLIEDLMLGLLAPPGEEPRPPLSWREDIIKKGQEMGLLPRDKSPQEVVEYLLQKQREEEEKQRMQELQELSDIL